MPVPAQISTLLFYMGVALVTIIPRLPNDRPFPYAIGGDLSYNFRRVTLYLIASNSIRVLFFEDSRFLDGAVPSDKSVLVLNVTILFRALESFLLSFLCLLTPYLMQCQLQNRINISSPGRDLMSWVYLAVLFSVTSCILVEWTDDAKYWCIKKLGDALSFPPVYKTLKLYSSIITPGGRYPKRGDMSVQTLWVVEYLTLISSFLSAIGYVAIRHKHPMFEAFRYLGAYAQLTRLLCHATLMNSKDEMEYYSKFATTTAQHDHADENGTATNGHGESSTTTAALVRSI